MLLELLNLSVHYGMFKALDNINLRVEKGELVVLLGANGAGKSTIFRTISGLIKPTFGTIQFNQENISGIPPNRIVEKGIVQCAEGRKLFPQMTVEENLQLGGYVIRKNKALLKESIEEIYELFPVLKEKRNSQVASLSGGQQQMLAIGRALISKPKIFLLDEPSIGLAPLIVEQVFESIKEINKRGTTILLAEQNAYAALKIANRGYCIQNGKIVLSGTKEDILSNEEIRKAYIGA